MPEFRSCLSSAQRTRPCRQNP
ncbi:MAG TPA: hypothetical protein DCZ71_02320 [Ruminococcus sp.]|nr:hypothetical protein [Ruminococcus sp.]